MLLAVVGEWSTLVLDSGTDKLGCWMQIKLQGTKQGTLKIYNIYNICKKCIDRAGPATAYMHNNGIYSEWQVTRTQTLTSSMHIRLPKYHTQTPEEQGKNNHCQ
jgi:hypothetical protein